MKTDELQVVTKKFNNFEVVSFQVAVMTRRLGQYSAPICRMSQTTEPKTVLSVTLFTTKSSRHMQAHIVGPVGKDWGDVSTTFCCK
jgi:hypothetical protein